MWCVNGRRQAAPKVDSRPVRDISPPTESEPMTPITEHPLTGYFDAVAMYGRPPATEIDELVSTLVDDNLGAPIKSTELRKAITDATTRMLAARQAGDAGQAREIGRTTATNLAGRIGDHEPAPPAQTKTPAEIVAGIPRTGEFR